MIVGVLLVLEGESTVTHMVEILEPLEVGDRDTAGVDVQVGYDEHVASLEYLVGLGRRGSVGALGDDLGLNARRVVLGDLLLAGCRHQNVALLAQEFANVGL